MPKTGYDPLTLIIGSFVAFVLVLTVCLTYAYVTSHANTVEACTKALPAERVECINKANGS